MIGLVITMLLLFGFILGVSIIEANHRGWIKGFKDYEDICKKHHRGW
jgi:hypothetical protein